MSLDLCSELQFTPAVNLGRVEDVLPNAVGTALFAVKDTIRDVEGGHEAVARLDEAKEVVWLIIRGEECS